jgi:hypothetical protein
MNNIRRRLVAMSLSATWNLDPVIKNKEMSSGER